MAHTPGPWKIGNAVLRRHFGQGEVEIQDSSSGMICEMYRENFAPGIDAANAKLIAAAPDLLAICQEIADTQCDLKDSERRIRLYSAIHKATGTV